MITVTFFKNGKLFCGFCISGHSDYSNSGSDIVCAAVSSASLMTANTITDIQGLHADVTVGDGYLKLIMSPEEAEKAVVSINGLKLHLSALSEQYKKNIIVKISEV